MLGQIWRRAALKWDIESLSILVWALWGSVSPRSLRLFLSSLIRARDFTVRHRFSDGRARVWRPTLKLTHKPTTEAADPAPSMPIEATSAT